MDYEVFKKHGRGKKYLGTFEGISSGFAAISASRTFGKGTYFIRPEYSNDKFFAYRVG